MFLKNKEGKIHLNSVLDLQKKNPCTKGPTQFKPTLLRSQLEMFCLIPPTVPHKSPGHPVAFLSIETQGHKLLRSCELLQVFGALLPTNRREEEDRTKHTCFLLH